MVFVSKESLQAVKDLASILRDTELSEIEYEQDKLRIKVVKETKSNLTYVSSNSGENMTTSSVSNITSKSEVIAKEDFESDPGLIKSPMVGTVYLSPSLESKPFVQVGTKVTKDQTILLIEAMKVYNVIKAPKEGIVKQIFVSNEEPVEYGQNLFIIG